MDIVTTQQDIDRNLQLLDATRKAGKGSEFFNTYCRLIANGRCFIPYETDGQLHFAPSRFVGYKNVSFQKHAASDDLDGKVTNPAISKVLGVPLIEDARLDAIYKKFLVETLGYIDPIPKSHRKFWLTDGAINHALTTDSDDIAFESVPETARQALILARKGQSDFRKSLIKHWQGCAVTGCTLIAVLKASHIKPWHDSTDMERLDPNNGLLLSPNLDALFDLGLITFQDDGSILHSKGLSKAAQNLLLPESVRLNKSKLTQQHKFYLAFHREHVFRQ